MLGHQEEEREGIKEEWQEQSQEKKIDASGRIKRKKNTRLRPKDSSQFPSQQTAIAKQPKEGLVQ